MGICDRSSGTCACRLGFTGAACQFLDCPRDADGSHCSGNGWCVNANMWAAARGVAYGDETNTAQLPQTWDAFKYYHCMCSARTPDGLVGNEMCVM